jgi:hypothetical protein
MICLLFLHSIVTLKQKYLMTLSRNSKGTRQDQSVSNNSTDSITILIDITYTTYILSAGATKGKEIHLSVSRR